MCESHCIVESSGKYISHDLINSPNLVSETCLNQAAK